MPDGSPHWAIVALATAVLTVLASAVLAEPAKRLVRWLGGKAASYGKRVGPRAKLLAQCIHPAHPKRRHARRQIIALWSRCPVLLVKRMIFNGFRRSPEVFGCYLHEVSHRHVDKHLRVDARSSL